MTMDQHLILISSGASTAPGAGEPNKRSPTGLAQFDAGCRGKMCLLRVNGDVDFSNSPALEAAIVSATREHRGSVVVSFVDCKYADSACARILIRQFKLLASRLLIVAPPASRLRRFLDTTSLTDTLPVYGDLCQAQLALASRSTSSLADLMRWQSSSKKRARMDAMMSLLRPSHRFRPAGPAKVSFLRELGDTEA